MAVHLIGSPLALASEEYARKAWLNFSDIPALSHPDVTILQGSVSAIDATNRTATIAKSDSTESIQHSYDYLVAASGLRRVWPTVPQSLTKKKFLSEADEQISSIMKSEERVVVVGGGAVGVEMAAELKLVQPHLKVTLIHSRDTLLSAEDIPAEVGAQSQKLLEDGGVEVILGQRVLSVEQLTENGIILQDLTLADGSHIRASKVISAVSKPTATSSYLPVGTLNEEGLVKVDPRYEDLIFWG
jgi:NADPH-dependent 2,4-dienoyl-CoA reductase/sulfur reductase-like enzyme